MLKAIPERLTYAQQRLVKLIEARELRRWCTNNGLTHSSIYRIALNEQIPTYKTICEMAHLIAPIEWLFYTDEKLPYKAQLVFAFDPKKSICKYIKEHRFDYKTIAEKYGLSNLSAYNLFVTYKARPTAAFIRQVCAEVNPIEFFTESIKEIPEQYIPERGDIISHNGELLFVLTTKEYTEKHTYVICCLISSDCMDGITLEKTHTKGTVNPYAIISFSFARPMPTLIETADKVSTKKIMKKATEFLVL